MAGVAPQSAVDKLVGAIARPMPAFLVIGDKLDGKSRYKQAGAENIEPARALSPGAGGSRRDSGSCCVPDPVPFGLPCRRSVLGWLRFLYQLAFLACSFITARIITNAKMLRRKNWM